MKAQLPLSLILGLILLPVSKGFSQNIEMWSYQGTGTSISLAWSPSSPTITDAHYAEIGGTNMSDSQVQRWELLFSTDYLFGRSSNLVRGADVTEDWDINWSTPTVYNTPASSRWVSIEGNYASATYIFKNTANTGPHPNQPFLENPNILGVVDDRAIFWDGDGTISEYVLTGGLYSDRTWTTLNGGELDGQNLSESLLRQYFIGAEESQMAFLVGDDRIEYYNITNGDYIRFADYSGVTTGPLTGDVTVADIIDGKVEGWTYIGIDNVIPGPVFASFTSLPIPEPGTWALMLGGTVLVGTFRRRLRAVS